jgi:DNA (cytosine-5)-methyltransferase 1
MKIFYVDLFSGAGGTTTGVHLAGPNIEVAACVNHDEKAIESHKANHPECIHFVEDVRDMKVIRHISSLCRKLRKEYPGCIINLWASLECTNYSKAKGGQPRDGDSRTLAYALYKYLEGFDFDYVWIENVREFMSWGPLDENGRPISRMNGVDYVRWVKTMTSYGYRYDWKMLNSADFGAYTSRERYFGQFAKTGLPITWPQPTHTKKLSTDAGFFPNTLKPWKSVREVLDLQDEGQSIFTRKKPLVEATLQRIYAGLIKFVAGGEDSFIQKHFSGRPAGKVTSLRMPAGTITTSANQSIVRASMLTSYYGNSHSAQSTDKPCPTITTKDRFSAVFIDQQFGQGKPISVNRTAGSITTIPKMNLVNCKWLMDTNFKNVGRGLNEPANTILACRKHQYLMNPQFQDKGRSIDRPCFTLIAKMDKKPPYLISPEPRSGIIKIDSGDSPTMKKIKEFMKAYGIVDIKMRMLKIPELLRIQGFPDGYRLKGTQGDQKKFIGNSVVPAVAKAIAKTNADVLIRENKQVETVA